MTNEEQAAMYLEKLRLYFTDISKPLKHLQDVIDPNNDETTDPNVIGIKAMCGNLYLCLFYINQISIVANNKQFMELTTTIQKVFMEYKPLIDKMVNTITKEFEDKGLNFVNGTDTIQ